MRRSELGWLVVVVGFAGLWPWLDLIPQLPWGPDAAKWIDRTATDQPGWWAWAVGTRHFVGYRPVTALSFSLNHAVFGYSAAAYRLVDIALHCVSGVLAAALYRQWTGDRSVVGLVPLLVMFGHPAIEEVVPYVARRSYLLAAVAGLGSLLCLGTAARAVETVRRHRWGMAAAGLFGAAALSHEVAYVLLPLVPFVLLHQARRGQGLGTVLAGVWVPAVALYAVLARYAVLGSWGGGYVKRYFAALTVAGPLWRELPSWQPQRIAEACWQYLVVPHGPTGDPSLLDGAYAGGWVLLVAVGLSLWCTSRAVLRIDDRGARAAALAGAWLVGGTLLVVLSQTWFWRQAAALLPGLGIVMATVVRAGWDGVAERRWADVGAGGIVAVALVGMLWQGPLVQGGMSDVPHRARIQGTATLDRLLPHLDGLPERSRVYLVVAERGKTAQMVRTWAERHTAAAHVDVRVLAHATGNGDRRRIRARVVAGDGSRRLVLSGPVQSVGTPHVQQRGVTDSGVELVRLRSRNRAVWLVFVGAREVWRKPVNGRPRSRPIERGRAADPG